jgi:predicted nucleic acid-binding protein
LTALIIDASATAPFFLADEASDRIAAVSDAVRDGNCVVPAIWRWEVANMLWKAIRTGRLKHAELDGVLRDIENFSVTVDLDSVEFALRQTLALANRHGLTAYDAAYLELAQRKGAELASHDTDLRRAALAENIAILPAR